MSVLIHCDQCGKTAATDFADAWWYRVVSRVRGPSERHFCSKECVVDCCTAALKEREDAQKARREEARRTR